MDTIRRVTVLGAGLMGHGIAQEFAVAGLRVRLCEVVDAVRETALSRIRGNLELLSGHGLMSADAIGLALGRIELCGRLEDAASDADLVIEAVSEDLALKQQIFGELDRLCPAHTILASNTSTFMPGLLAAATRRPDRVIIAHYFNPPYLLPLVEVVPCAETSAHTRETVVALLKRIGKRPVELRKEVPGFVANRLQAALLREACSIVAEGIASPQSVDEVVCSSIGRRLAYAGPFEIADAAGLDLWCAIAAQLLPTLSNDTEIPEILRERVSRGEAGIKSRKGFYAWEDDAVAVFRQRMAAGLLAISHRDSAGQPGV